MTRHAVAPVAWLCSILWASNAAILSANQPVFDAPTALWDAGADGVDCNSPSDDIFGSDHPLSCTNSYGVCRGEGIGLLRPSDHCFDDFISPMINFVFFEDPRTLTELRPIFVNHWVPDNIGSGVTAGGTIQLYALQFRAVLTERLSLIAVKDGFIVDHTDGALDSLLNDGWAAVTAGLKYNLFRDPVRGSLTSVGFTYEIPIGSRQALQYVGNGEFHLFFTKGKRFFDGRAHWLTSVGYRVPVDDDVQNSAIHWSNHFDYRVTEGVYVFTEFARWHWTDDASRGLPLGVAGQDLFNLPSNNVVGKDLITENIGVKFKPYGNSEVGIAYEFPLTNFKDVIDGRLMVDWNIRF